MSSFPNPSNKKSSVEDRITGNGESSFTSTLIKMALALLMTLLPVVLYIYIAKPSGLPFTHSSDSAAVVSVVGDNIPGEEQMEERAPATHQGVTIFMDDPNEPPYHMLGVIAEDGKKMFTFELPDGGPTDGDNDSTLTVAMTIEPGTNLSESLLTVTLRKGVCTAVEEEENAGVMQAGDVEFRKSESSDAGAGQYYSTFNYSFEKNGKCVMFSLRLHSSNVMAFNPPVNEFDLAEEIRKMEDMLKTMKEY
jgi:hypothetical protein